MQNELCEPSLKTLAYWIFIFVIFLPWMVIASKFHLLNRLFNFMDELMLKNDEDVPKKNGLFYQILIIYYIESFHFKIKINFFFINFYL